VRGEFLETFVMALLPLHTLDRFTLAGVVASWWTDTLPDFKTLLENGFPGVIDGWVDAITDAVDDDDSAGPPFDPFAHKLVRCTMADYLERIASIRTDISRYKGEKEAFEQSNAPEDMDEEELTTWNYARDLDRQARELKAEHKDALKRIKKLDIAATKPRSAAADKQAAVQARAVLAPVLEQLAVIEQALLPYEQIKAGLAQARTCYRQMTKAFVAQLKTTCDAMNADQKHALVLDLFAQDLQNALEGAVAEKRQGLVGFLERLWDKYQLTLINLQTERTQGQEHLTQLLERLRYR
jgi:type I restriction enzyme M protein